MGLSRRLVSPKWLMAGWALAATVATTLAPALAGDSRPSGVKLDPAVEEFFEARVRPVLAARCLECHGTEKPKGGLRLDARESMLRGGEAGPVIVPGKPEESLLVEAIRYEGGVSMPPKGKLKDEEIAALTEWVRRGAPWPSSRPDVARRAAAAAASASSPSPSPTAVIAQARSLWSFQPVGDPVPPAVRDESWPGSPIDRFVLARLEANGLAPSPPADKATLIRRVTF